MALSIITKLFVAALAFSSIAVKNKIMGIKPELQDTAQLKIYETLYGNNLLQRSISALKINYQAEKI